MTTNTLRAYRDSASEFGTYIDVLLVCYDALAEDIRSAGIAAAEINIPERCRYSDRAALLLGHLESWVSLLEDDEPLQQSLVRFYQYLRTELLQLQATSDSGKYNELSMRVCETRAVWQRKQATASSRFTPEASQHFSCSI